ncbi:MAG: hypothetical protein AB7F59_04975 [Bdellovibrionales bacterium]
MVTEVIIILTLFFVIAATMVGQLKTTFKGSAPKLGAKIEKHIETGSGFTEATSDITWRNPPGPPP